LSVRKFRGPALAGPPHFHQVFPTGNLPGFQGADLRKILHFAQGGRVD
jgi:hypothetical protein